MRLTERAPAPVIGMPLRAESGGGYTAMVVRAARRAAKGTGRMQPVVRVSIVRCAPEHFAELRQMMAEADPVLRPGIEAMAGLLAFYVGADEATRSLSNVSVWTSLEAARQMDTFQPMLELGKVFVAKGATFERPIMNYATLWRLGGSAVPGAAAA